MLAGNASHIDGQNRKTLIWANGRSDESGHPFQNYLSLLKDLLPITASVAILELENHKTFHQKKRIKLF